jgi:hypothetical protein
MSISTPTLTPCLTLLPVDCRGRRCLPVCLDKDVEKAGAQARGRFNDSGSDRAHLVIFVAKMDKGELLCTHIALGDDTEGAVPLVPPLLCGQPRAICSGVTSSLISQAVSSVNPSRVTIANG